METCTTSVSKVCSVGFSDGLKGDGTIGQIWRRRFVGLIVFACGMGVFEDMIYTPCSKTLWISLLMSLLDSVC